MTLVLTEQIRIIRHNPTAVNIIIELIVALDGSEFGSALWPLVLWIAISFYLCLLKIWKGKAFATFAMGSLLFDFAVCDSASPYLLGFPWFRVSHCGNLEQ